MKKRNPTLYGKQIIVIFAILYGNMPKKSVNINEFDRLTPNNVRDL